MICNYSDLYDEIPHEQGHIFNAILLMGLNSYDSYIAL